MAKTTIASPQPMPRRRTEAARASKPKTVVGRGRIIDVSSRAQGGIAGAAAPGHKPGHADHGSAGFGWNDYVGWLVKEHGSLAAVALALSRADRTLRDPSTIERALRRLRLRSTEDGGDWGSRTLRAFGVPREVEDRTRWMGLYHSRFSDLPVPVCLDLLHVWSKPPVSESKARAFVMLGLAHVALRTGDLDTADARLESARGASAGLATARCELLLVSAYLASRRGQRERSARLLAEAESAISRGGLGDDGPSFDARFRDQMAYWIMNREDRDLPRALALYRGIDEAGPPFARCKRSLGLAYVAWRSGEPIDAERHARDAITHAGDGGLVRQRVIALGLLARVVDEPEKSRCMGRALSLASELDDRDLSARLSRS